MTNILAQGPGTREVLIPTGQLANVRDLTGLQFDITMAAIDIRNYSETADYDSETQHTNLGKLTELFAELHEQIDASAGLYLGGFPVTSDRMPTSEKKLVAEHGLDVDDLGRSLLYVTRSRIGAICLNPLFYDTGHDVKPVLDIQITRSWFRIPLESTDLAVNRA